MRANTASCGLERRLACTAIEAGKLTWFAGKEQLVSPDVRAITESPDGALWFGMLGGGLGRWKDGALKQFRKQDGLSSDFVLALYAEADGTLWIGTSDNGLCRLREGKFATISTPQGMLASIISQIADDGAGNLWMGSHHGILRVSKADLNRCANGEATSVRCLSYGKAEGLASQKCSGGFQPAVCQTTDGRLWFPTAKGLAIIDPRSFTTNTVPPPVVIEELVVEGQPVKLRRATAANRRGRRAPGDCRFRPASSGLNSVTPGLSFTAPDKVRFRYKLEGLEKDWVEAGTKRVAQYSYLPPGTYTFRVIACNNDDVWNEQGASLSFTVLPHFWQTWWFQAALLAAGGGGGGRGWRCGARAGACAGALEQLERQRALERERARIARDIHDDLGSSLTRISLLSQSARAELDDRQAGGGRRGPNLRHRARADAGDGRNRLGGQSPARHPRQPGGLPRALRAELPEHGGHPLPPGFAAAPASWPLTAEVRHNVFLAFKEALNNVVKHAQASEVRISLELKPEGFMLVVADNGRGFVWNPQTGPTGAGRRRVARGGRQRAGATCRSGSRKSAAAAAGTPRRGKARGPSWWSCSRPECHQNTGHPIPAIRCIRDAWR